jgi:hypothetical protein
VSFSGHKSHFVVDHWTDHYLGVLISRKITAKLRHSKIKSLCKALTPQDLLYLVIVLWMTTNIQNLLIVA